MSIHSRIRERRIELGLTSHKALADLVGVSWQTVQLWEKEDGGTAPNRTRLPKVAAALRVTPEWLMSGDRPDEKAAHLSLVPSTGAAVDILSAQTISDEVMEIFAAYQTAPRQAQENILDFVRSATRGTSKRWIRKIDKA